MLHGGFDWRKVAKMTKVTTAERRSTTSVKKEIVEDGTGAVRRGTKAKLVTTMRRDFGIEPERTGIILRQIRFKSTSMWSKTNGIMLLTS